MNIVCWRTVFFAILIFQPENGAARPQGSVPPAPPPASQTAADMWRGLAKNGRDLIEKGSALESQGRIEEALAIYQKAYTLYPNHTVTNAAVGSTYQKMGRTKEAIPYLERALSLDKSNFFIFANLVHARTALGDRVGAAQLAVECAGFFPNLVFTQGLLGDALYSVGKYDAAIAAYSKAQTLPGGDKDPSLNEDLAWCYVAKEDYARALSLLGNSARIGVTFQQNGLIITEVRKNGPADLAGIREGDQPLALNGENLSPADTASFVKKIQNTPVGQKVHVKLLRAGQLLEMDVSVGITPDSIIQHDVPAANAANLIAAPVAPAAVTSTTPAVIPAPVAAPDVKAPAITINRVDVKPATIRPGETFSIEVSYTATVGGQIARTFSIHDGTQTLFESQPQTVEAVVGRAGLITISKVPSASKPGKYAIRVHLVLGNAKAEGEAVLTITQK